MPEISEVLTPYSEIYKAFQSRITEDYYMELTPEETEALQYELLEAALPWFEFPRFDTSKRNDEGFLIQLTNEEIGVIAVYMLVEWIGQQLAAVDLTRMKYSSSDFKFTSQANHMHKLNALKREYERIGFHLQRLYKRRKKDKDGIMRSTFNSIMSTSPDWRN